MYTIKTVFILRFERIITQYAIVQQALNELSKTLQKDQRLYLTKLQETLDLFEEFQKATYEALKYHSVDDLRRCFFAKFPNGHSLITNSVLHILPKEEEKK